MKIVQVNVTCTAGSTGKICKAIGERVTEQGSESYIFHVQAGVNTESNIACATPRYIRSQAIKSRLLGNYGFNSRAATKRLIAHLKEIQPDIVHLHNLHSHNVHLGLLFSYLKEKQIKVVWTFHDCWAFTGYCPHFVMAGCDQWKTGCEHCPQRRDHSFLFDRSRELYRKKRELFTGLDMTVVTPSRWLAGLVRESFLKDYPVAVINNGIDLSVFCPRESDFRERYRIPEDKRVLLGVAFDWGIRKGLDVFLKLAESLDPDRYQIVLVGTNDTVDKQLPKNIISIHRTQDQQELAEIYSAADLLLNPTREDTYPTVNMESLACGTPVLTFQTGGSPEMLDEACGATVPCDDVEAFKNEILYICENTPFSSEQCVRRARSFDRNEKFREYVDLYSQVVSAEESRHGNGNS
jgi:glycosyltransferase involved in cell wall biosynthesis